MQEFAKVQGPTKYLISITLTLERVVTQWLFMGACAFIHILHDAKRTTRETKMP
jgi:hypothetical protein